VENIAVPRIEPRQSSLEAVAITTPNSGPLTAVTEGNTFYQHQDIKISVAKKPDLMIVSK
jgi:hypothetical protein